MTNITSFTCTVFVCYIFFVLLARFFVTSLELLQSFNGIFVLQNTEIDLYTEITKLAMFRLQNRGINLYTGKYGNTLSLRIYKTKKTLI